MRRSVAATLLVLLFVGIMPGVALAKTTISPAFIKKVNAYCVAENARITKALGGAFPYPNFDPTHPDVKTMKQVGKYYTKVVPTRRAIPNDLSKLGQPQAGKSQWGAIKALELQQNQIALVQVRDALAGNAKAFVTTVNQLTTVGNQIESEEIRYGFSRSTPCTQVF
jgi:hypothetical protein